MGSALQPRFRSGREPRAGCFPNSGLRVGRWVAREEGRRRRGLGGSWRETGDGPPGREEPAHSTQPPPVPNPRRPAPLPHSMQGTGCAPSLWSRGGMRSRGLKGEFTDACEGKSCPRSPGVEPRTRPQKASRRSLEVSENRMGRNLGLGALPALSGRAWGSLAGAPRGPRAGRFQHLGELRPSPDPAGSILRYQALALLPRSETAVFGPRQGRNRPLHVRLTIRRLAPFLEKQFKSRPSFSLTQRMDREVEWGGEAVREVWG